MRRGLLVLLVLLLAGTVGVAAPEPAAAATCADHPNQASAQRAKDTRDGDGDGIYCESLPCPCLRGTADAPPPRPRPAPARRGCRKPEKVQSITFSAARYPNIHAHARQAIAAGFPRVLKLHRTGADRRRARAVRGVPTRGGHDRDEYPPAVGRSTWRAHVAHVPSSENRSHGAALGNKLRRFCAGTRFRYVFS